VYDLLLHGVKANIEPLENGDTILVPTIGPQVTVEEMVRRPAVYELRDEKTLADVLALSEGLLPITTLRHIEVQRIVEATRQFLYADDAAEAIVRAAEKYQQPEPVNIASGDEISMGDLVELIRGICGYQGGVEWDASKPDGQPRRCVDGSRAQLEFGWQARTALREGLERTIAWYEKELLGSESPAQTAGVRAR
jgi:nucleoside-diphosphate-sugar epimerase